jgi:hypothetical protein
MIRAALDALKNTCSPKYISDKRGKKVGEIISRREVKANGKVGKSTEASKGGTSAKAVGENK